MGQFVCKCKFCEFEPSYSPEADNPSNFGYAAKDRFQQTLPHHCEVCNRNPHNFVQGYGWVTKDWWGTEEATNVLEAKEVLAKLREKRG